MATHKKLNSEQTKAVKHGKGPLLIIAGAGTGKTTVITERIKYLISKELSKPEEILALTFTEKSSREMQERVDIALPLGYSNMWISTFHAFCDRVLRAEALAIGLSTDFHLMTEAENLAFLRRNLFEFDLEYFRPLGNPTKFLEGLLQHFSRLSDEDVLPDEYLKWAKQQAKFIKPSKDKKLEIQKWLELANAFQKYEELKIEAGVFDYGDLLSKTLLLFRARPNVLKEYQEKFKYILIDEFQDTNYSQFQLAILLTGKRANITVVGDDDQSIYRFRGASISNILQFRNAFPKTKLAVLTQNYRSTQTILDHAYALIQFNNPDRLEVVEGINKKLIAAGNKKVGTVEVIEEDRVEEEAESVAQRIGELIDEGYSWRDCAILVRANNHADVFIRTFERMGIPHQFLGPGRLFKQKEILGLIAYLKVLYDFEDSVSLYGVLNSEFIDFPAKKIITLSNGAKKKQVSLFEILESKEELPKFVMLVNKHIQDLKIKTPGEVLFDFVTQFNVLEKVSDSEVKLHNITQFFEKLKAFENQNPNTSIANVVDWLNLSTNFGEPATSTDTDWTQNDAVNIMSVHASKGLEFPVVFLVNLVSQRFPTIARHEQIPLATEILKEVLPQGDFHLQEERRLFYVGMTRAKDKLFLTAAQFYGGEGGRQKKISQFVSEATGEILTPKTKQVTESKKDNIKKSPSTSSKLPVTNLSFSQIETFKMCPLHYKLKYIVGIETPISASQSFGISIHNAIQDYFENKKDLQTALKENWITEGYLDKKHNLASLKRAEKYLKGFEGKKFITPTHTEHKFEFKIDGLTINGIFDAVFSEGAEIEIVDFKTSENVPTQKEVDKNLQLSIYALAATKIFNKKVEQIKLSLYYFETQEKISTTRTTKQLKDIEKEIMGVKAEIEESNFTCSGSFFCQNCEYLQFCSA